MPIYTWQTFEETSGYVRPERVNKWPNFMTDRRRRRRRRR
jgi:hypothetical protein